MTRITFVFANLLLLACAKVFPINFRDNDLDDVPGRLKINLTDSHDSELWVLDLNDEGFDTLMLRKATEEEVEEFEFYNAPLIEDYLKHKSAVLKKNAAKLEVEHAHKTTDAVKPVSKEDIFKYLNKFALHSKTEADVYFDDSLETSVALLFKGQFTFLIVKVGTKRWQYFIQPAASQFPSWFYGHHTNSRPETVVLPEEVKETFYSALFRLLQVVLRYPV